MISLGRNIKMDTKVTFRDIMNSIESHGDKRLKNLSTIQGNFMLR